MFLACFGIVLHVVNICLDELFIKTCVYTCTSSGQQLILICLYFIAHWYLLYVHVYPSFDDPSFTLVLPILMYVLLHVYVIFI